VTAPRLSGCTPTGATVGERGRLVSRTELSRIAEHTCRACGWPYVLIMPAVARRKRCYRCHAVIVEAVGEIR
jgi:hypothetical protein